MVHPSRPCLSLQAEAMWSPSEMLQWSEGQRHWGTWKCELEIVRYQRMLLRVKNIKNRRAQCFHAVVLQHHRERLCFFVLRTEVRPWTWAPIVWSEASVNLSCRLLTTVQNIGLNQARGRWTRVSLHHFPWRFVRLPSLNVFLRCNVRLVGLSGSDSLISNT